MSNDSTAHREMETYVFGAGASAPYGAPTMGQFLSKAFAGWTLTPPDATDFERDLKIVAGAIDGQYGTNLLAAQQGGDHFSPDAEVALRKINVEELLALADENKKPDIRKALERVIYRTIESTIHQGSNREYYKQLMTELVESGQEACLISFNYDLLLDRALTDAARNTTGTWSYSLFYHGDNGPLLIIDAAVNPTQKDAVGAATKLIAASLDSVSNPDGSKMYFLGIHNLDSSRVLKIMVRAGAQTPMGPDYAIRYAVSRRWEPEVAQSSERATDWQPNNHLHADARKNGARR